MVDCLNRNVGIGSQRLIPGIEPIAGQFLAIPRSDLAQNILVNLRELLLAEGQLVEPGFPGLAKIGQTRRVDIKNQSDSAFLQSPSDIADQVASRCPAWMDGFPRVDRGRAVWMSMVQR